ncbi:MAG TPA: TAXI family TRAP transporter solute-binding subunit, partial [Alphaproteobacteria bacterium]|nr:TAXI family TRAP transporter solute-binding subunit [Alphaproteobacteria bacterium]
MTTLPVCRRTVIAGAMAALAGAGLLAAPAVAQDLPKRMVWTAYDLGSSGYADASAMANALTKKFGTRVRIVPSGSSIGRLLPLATGKASYGLLANEAYFSTEGTFEFADLQWGPQDLRVVMGRPATVGFATAKDANIKTIADLKGKRVGYVKGNPSVNVKNDAMLAFGGLSRKDVKVVEFGSYRAMLQAIKDGQNDAGMTVTTSGNMRELEASPRGLYWPPFPASNKEGWEKIHSVADFFQPRTETVGAAIPDGGVALVGYRYPMIVTYADTSADEVYALIKALDESFDLYKEATPGAERWSIKTAGRPPADAPWHEGAIRYLKEKGVWTAEDDAWQKKRLARLHAVQDAWEKATT